MGLGVANRWNKHYKRENDDVCYKSKSGYTGAGYQWAIVTATHPENQKSHRSVAKRRSFAVAGHRPWFAEGY